MSQFRSPRALPRRTAAVAAVIALCIAAAAPQLSATAAAVADDGWAAFSADVSLQQAVVSSTGAIVQSAPAVDMKVERIRRSTGWRTNVMLQRIELSAIRAGAPALVDNPLLVVRMEYDGDGTPARFFNRAGLRIAPPGDADRALLQPSMSSTMPVANLNSSSIIRTRFNTSNPEWTENVVATPGKRKARRTAIEQRYGQMRGRVNGMDQYLTTTGELACELLVNGDAVVPVEMNVARGAALVGRTLFTYEKRSDGSLMRRLLHAERALGSGRTDRLVADVTTANVVITKAGAQ